MLDIAVERRADGRVAQLALGELHRRRRGVDIGLQVLRLLQRGVIGSALEPQRRVGVVEHLLRDELTLVQRGRALEALPGLLQLGGRPPHVGRVFDSRQIARIGGAVSRESARVRGALLVEVVLQLLAIDLDERLSRRDAIAEIGEHATNDAVDLGRHRDLVLGSQRANHLEGASNRLLANRVRS